MQEMIKLSPHIVYMTPVEETDRPVLAAVTGKTRTLMIDAGNSEAHARLFLDKLTGLGIAAPALAAVTHWHWDHVFGMSALMRMPTISTAKTVKKLESLKSLSWDDASINERVSQGREIEFCADAIKKEFPTKRDIRIVLPTIAFEDRITIDLGGITCVLKQVGGDHSPDGLIVYIEEEKTVFLADALAPDLYSEFWSYTPENTIAMLDNIKEFDADTYLISHGKPLSRKEFMDEAAFLRKAAMISLNGQGKKADMIKEMERYIGGSLSEDQLQTLQYFENGKEKQNKKS